ncbi:hypothetical protein ACJX0J_020834, partial [Zea mays]
MMCCNKFWFISYRIFPALKDRQSCIKFTEKKDTHRHALIYTLHNASSVFILDIDCGWMSFESDLDWLQDCQNMFILNETCTIFLFILKENIFPPFLKRILLSITCEFIINQSS